MTCFPLKIFDSLSLLAVSRMKAEKQAQSIGPASGGPLIRLLETYVSILIIFN